MELEYFIKTIQKIKHCPLFIKYYLYCHNDISLVKWLFREFWFYKIEKPFGEFFSKQGNYVIGNCIKYYLTFQCGNKINHIDVMKLYGSDIIFPCVEIRVCIRDKYVDTLGLKLFHKLGHFRGFGHDLSIDICAFINNKWRPIYWK